MPKGRTESPEKLKVRKIARLFGIKARTLYLWIETDLIKPVLYTRRGGSVIILSYWNVLEIGVIVELRSKGASLQAVRKAVEYIEKMGSKVYERKLVVTEGDIRDYGSLSKMNGKEKATIISLVEQQGQMFFVDLRQIKLRVNKELKREKIRVSLT